MIKSKAKTIKNGLIMIAFMIIYYFIYRSCGSIMSFAQKGHIGDIELIFDLNVAVIYFMPFLTTLWLRKGSDFFACIGSILWLVLLFFLEQFVSFERTMDDLIVKTPIFSSSELININQDYRLMIIASIFFTSCFSLIINWAHVNESSESFGATFGKFMLSILFSFVPFSLVAIIDYVVYDGNVEAKIVYIVLFTLSLLFIALRIFKTFNKKAINSNNYKNGLNLQRSFEDNMIYKIDFKDSFNNLNYMNNNNSNSHKNESYKVEQDDRLK